MLRHPPVAPNETLCSLIPLLSNCCIVLTMKLSPNRLALCRKLAAKEQAARVAKFKRGDGVQTKRVSDKKLRGHLQHAERLSTEAAVAAAKTDEWLLPAEAGTLEAEGMEETWRFQQVGDEDSTVLLYQNSASRKGDAVSAAMTVDDISITLANQASGGVSFVAVTAILVPRRCVHF